MLIPNAKTKRVDQCIYCQNPGATDEHIVPIAFGGHHILIRGSCESCRRITSDRETFICEHNFNALRFHYDYPRASLGKRGSRAPEVKIIEGKTPHNAPFRKVPHDKAPGITIFPIFRPPGILLGHTPSERIEVPHSFILDPSGDGVRRQRALQASGFKGVLSYAQYNPIDFALILAKIAHGYAVFNVGLKGFRPLLPAFILGEKKEISYYVGGLFQDEPTRVTQTPTSPYNIVPFQIEIKGQFYLGAQIRLFASVRPLTPVYSVIFGQPI
jgi:hypothetical protein